jgi:hypothetical protein
MQPQPLNVKGEGKLARLARKDHQLSAICLNIINEKVGHGQSVVERRLSWLPTGRDNDAQTFQPDRLDMPGDQQQSMQFSIR